MSNVNAFIVALTGLIVAVATLVAAFAAYRQARKTHVIVNSQRTELDKRIDQLEQSLQSSDTDIPPVLPKDPS